jgi:hypothetical protein
MKHLVSTLVALLLGCTLLHAQHFTFQFTVHDAGGIGDTLDFGVDRAATYCEDEALFELNNDGPPPFPWMFTWVNPRQHDWLGADVGCFETGRMRYGMRRKLDLRPFLSTTQIDTFRVKFYSFEAGYPFHFSWNFLSRDKCDSMKLVYTLGNSEVVSIDMFSVSTDTIYDSAVSDVYIIEYGASGLDAPFPLAPTNGQTSVSRFARLEWENIGSGVTYGVEMALDSLFTTPVYQDTVTTTPYRPGLLPPWTTYYWHVRSVAPGNPSAWSTTRSFRTIGMIYPFAVTARWNLVSVPLTVNDARPSAVFNGALTPAYAYSASAGYAQAETLVSGRGYWMKFPYAYDYGMEGGTVRSDTAALESGWNLIGSVNDTIPVGDLVTEPAGIINSTYYGYAGGFRIASTVSAAHGYWVHATDPGMLILSSTPGARKTSPVQRSLAAAFEAMPGLDIADTSGSVQRLLFGVRPADLPENWMLTLPPRPAGGGFDARFASQTMVEFETAGTARSLPIEVTTDSYPVMIRWEGGTPGAVLSVGSASYSMAAPGSALVKDGRSKILLRLGAGGALGLPDRFSVAQNYPNPFNPQTVISYVLPSETRVKIVVYNLLGEEVATVVDAVEGPGDHVVRYSPANLASGVYIYRVSADGESVVRRMLYLK